MEIVGVNNFQKFSFSKTANEMLGYFENRPITVLEKCLLLSETTTTATEKYLNLQQISKNLMRLRKELQNH